VSSLNCYIVCDTVISSVKFIDASTTQARGHPFMTSTRRGGARLRWTHADGVGVSSMWTSIQKIRAHWRHPVFFSCKEVSIFGPEFCLWTE